MCVCMQDEKDVYRLVCMCLVLHACVHTSVRTSVSLHSGLFVCAGVFSKTGVYSPHDEKNSMLSHCGEKHSQSHSADPSSPLEDVTRT